MAIADYLRKLVELKNQLVVNLQSMGVAADESEKLNTLVPKVLECGTKQNVEFVEGTDFKGTSNKAGFLLAMSKINIPNGTTTIGDYAFYYVTHPTSITIPDSVTSIGSYAFGNCSSLASITIPDSVTSIGNSAFQDCSSLASITIPDSVTSIGSYAFGNCSSLADIYYTGTETQWNNITKSTGWNYNMGSNVSGGTTIHYNYVRNKEVIK